MSADTYTICGKVLPSQGRARFEERFWEKVRRGDGCWEWAAQRQNHGYGRFAVSRCNMHLAHRVAWELASGPIPESLCVLHRCDNPCCVRPDHLFLGTKKANTRDMLRKGREARGERHGVSKLTAGKVLEACRLREEGMTYAAIGARLGVNRTAVYKVIKRKRWGHVP
jgi:hypothetical protein